MKIHTCVCSDYFCIDYACVCSDHFADDFEHNLRAELLNTNFTKHWKSTAVTHIKIPSIIFSTKERHARAQKQEIKSNFWTWAQKIVENLLKVLKESGEKNNDPNIDKQEYSSNEYVNTMSV